MTFFKKRLCLVVLIHAIAVSTFSQPGGPFTKMPPLLLRKDLTMLKDTLEKIHPGLYRYKDKLTLDRIFDSCLGAIKDSMTVTGFYALTSYFIGAIEDGHTNCRLPGSLMNEYMNQVKVFPAMVQFIHDRAFIICCNQDADLAESELLSINHHPLREIIQRLFAYIPSDGGITSRKNWELSGAFPLLYNIVYGAQNDFTIAYRTKNKSVKSTVLQADYSTSIKCANLFTRPKKYLQLSYEPGNIAILTIKTFFNGFLNQTGEHFSQFIDSAFSDITNKGTRKLLIDLRGNQGGNDENGALLYRYLTAKSFEYYASLASTTSIFPSNAHPNLGTQYSKENNFGGKVYLLTDGRSFSTTAEFAAVVKSNNRGKFIGEEAGGGYYGNTSGDDITLNLPYSGISCRIPMVKYTLAVKKLKQKDNGIMPDYPVYLTISDLVEGKDRQMEYALKIVTKE
jgi:hypothetical protein